MFCNSYKNVLQEFFLTLTELEQKDACTIVPTALLAHLPLV